MARTPGLGAVLLGVSLRALGLMLVLLLTQPALAQGDGPAKPERRVALVIGNSAYLNTTLLPNPTNDARTIAGALRDVGFEVVEAIDLPHDPFVRRLREFERAVTGADLGLVFYAGHGIQVGGENYLVPIDAALQREADIEFETVSLGTVMRTLRNAVTRVVILDACRSNPLARAMARLGTGRSVGRGLAAIEQPDDGALVAFATAPGAEAADGTGANSPFTTALLKHLPTPGLEINVMLTRVRVDVREATGGEQIPWTSSSLAREVYLAGLRKPRALPPGFVQVVGRYPEPRAVFKDCAGCPEMVVVPAGKYLRGSSNQEREWVLKQGGTLDETQNEQPRREVTIDRPLAFGRTEVTRALYARFIAANPGREPRKGCTVLKGGRWTWDEARSWRDPGFAQGDDEPVVCVSWQDAMPFIIWLNGQAGSDAYRLPTEAEWEHAARGGTRTWRWWGDDADNMAGCSFANVADEAAKDVQGLLQRFGCRDDASFTAKAGAKRANAFGLLDVLGNVWEWTQDCYKPGYDGVPVDGAAHSPAACADRVLRGASWTSYPKDLRAAERGWRSPAARYANVGFRVARVIEP